MFPSLEMQYQPLLKGEVIQPWRWGVVASQNMSSISVNTGNWKLRVCSRNIHKQTMLSKDCELCQSK